MIVSRRGVLAGATAALVVGSASAQAGERVTAALDAAAAEKDPARALSLLKAVRADGVARSIALDLAAARSGLALDVQLAGLTGAARYTPLLKCALGDDADPDRAQRRLDTEMQRLLTRAERLFANLGDTQGGTGARYSRLWGDPRYLYADDETGRARAVAAMNATLDRLKRTLPAAFAPLPAYCLDVSARALTPEEIAAGKPGFRSLPEPGKPGLYIVDLKDINRRPAWTLPSVVAHELLPGHMIQMPLAAAAHSHPLRTGYTPAFAEGWGVYAEELAGQQGAFADPRDELGHIHWLVFRVTRGLVDLGIHQHGWSVADAKAKLVEWMGEPAYFALFDPDLARIAREPAIRTAEAIAWLTIADRARSLKGDRLRRFHTAVLTHGPLRTEQIAAIATA